VLALSMVPIFPLATGESAPTLNPLFLQLHLAASDHYHLIVGGSGSFLARLDAMHAVLAPHTPELQESPFCSLFSSAENDEVEIVCHEVLTREHDWLAGRIGVYLLQEQDR